jgi:hypothetical protein
MTYPYINQHANVAGTGNVTTRAIDTNTVKADLIVIGVSTGDPAVNSSAVESEP